MMEKDTEMAANLKKEYTSVSDFAEYSYGKKHDHLSEEEAINRYKQVKVSSPDAIVELDDLDCGHWSVSVFSTESEKEAYFQNRINNLMQRLLAMLKTSSVKR
jgi:hypothetical protein